MTEATTMEEPAATREEMAEELVRLARRIKCWQEARKLTTAAMLRRFSGLGSDKLYGRLVKGDTGETDVERQLARYRAVWALIESTEDSRREEEPLYDDLSPAIRLRKAFVEVADERGNGRFILVQGDSGSGKTSAARALMAKYGARLAFVELSPVVGDSPFNFLLLVLEAIGVQDAPKSAVG